MGISTIALFDARDKNLMSVSGLIRTQNSGSLRALMNQCTLSQYFDMGGSIKAEIGIMFRYHNDVKSIYTIEKIKELHKMIQLPVALHHRLS